AAGRARTGYGPAASENRCGVTMPDRVASKARSVPNFSPAQSIPLEAVFADPYFMEAPSYQRRFVWTNDAPGQLPEDVMSAQEAGSDDYFLGTLLFLERILERDPSVASLRGWRVRRAPPNRQFEIVDGLQRLTTLTILFCVLRDLGGT